MRMLEMRGLPAAVLIDFVHRNGGILGPAHPCGGKYLSFTNTKRYFKNPELIKRFDFMEAFNAYFVHRNGGILGPAHPCGGKYLSFTNTKRYFKNPELIKRFDFMEAFNACESVESNEGALRLSQKYQKPGI